MAKQQLWRNRWGFGLGTVGRDMTAAMVSMYLMFYATDVLNVSNSTLAMITGVIVFMRVFDGVNDPFMGTLVDNTRSRWGKFKPWMLGGAVLWAIFHVLMFVDTGLKGVPFVIVFTLFYFGWEISYTANDISYWSMIPALSRQQKEREKIGSVARICANVGMFALVVALIPVTNYLAGLTGSLQKGWTALAVITAVLMLGFQMFTLFWTQEEKIVAGPKEKTRFSELFRIIFKNDQLMVITGAMLLFMCGYTLTASLGIYYFKYAFGDENMYSIFALILGVSQLSGLAVFPLLSRRWKRAQLFGLGIAMVILGYICFFVSPMHMLPIGFSGVLIFVGQSFIQLLMLMYIADAVEYGEWKLHKRNESVTFSLQPLIYKVSNAMANALVGFSLFASRIQGAESAADLTARDVSILKIFMMAIPTVLVAACYVIITKYYKIDEAFYAKILRDNQATEARLLKED